MLCRGMDVWSERFWLAEGVTWEDMHSNATFTFPRAGEMQHMIAAGVVIMLLRILIESLVFLPIGWLFGWVAGPLFPRVWVHITGGFAGKSKFKRVSECAWRFVYYTAAFIAGYVILSETPQWESVDNSWIGWPFHHVTDKVWWYYIIETGFYWALLFSSVLFDVRRNDFVEMTIHHTITIALLWLSWSINFVRIGTLVLICHDAADVFIELGKLCRYARWETALNVIFLVFYCVWVATRLVIYPFWILWSVWFDAPALIQASYEWLDVWQRPIVPRIFVVMLSMLLVLHVFWTILITKIAYQAATKEDGKIDDTREDSDDEDEERKKEE